jgi:hypothetical protein
MGLRDLFSRKPKPTPSELPYQIREVLFGDLPLSEWPRTGADASQFPWSVFDEARGHVACGDVEAARRCWLHVVETPGQESLHYVQAWHFLRAHGHNPPPEIAQQVLGTIVEYTMAEGLDIVAAYPDHNARYYNHAGGAVAWLQGDGSLDGAIDALLAASEPVVRQIGPWTEARLPAPPTGQVRISFLTPSGLHFGQGPMNGLSADPMGGPVIHRALELMQALMKASGKG